MRRRQFFRGIAEQPARQRGDGPISILARLCGECAEVSGRHAQEETCRITGGMYLPPIMKRGCAW